MLEGDGFQGKPRLSLKSLNPDLCCAQQLVRRSFGRQSSSPWSSDNQATGRLQHATHSLTSVVLPKPAEAEMRVSLRPEERPSVSRSIRRGRRTILARGGGMKSLVAKIDMGIDSL